MRREPIICLALVLITASAFWPLNRCDFITFDDHEYIVANPVVNNGLGWGSASGAFTAVVVSNWHPLTLLSHALDCQIFGLNARAHHMVNLLFHTLNGLLLFLLLQRMTGSRWRSALVAALFAVHPLHVESVAWLSERKDVLSTMFGLLSMRAYARYAEEAKARNPRSKIWHGLALGWFALGLMSKPMLVTLPFVLLLLDYWPLARLELSAQGWKLKGLASCLREKIPFFGLAAASSVVTYLVQEQTGAVRSAAYVGFLERISNALISYLRYIGKTVWPSDLAFYYPHPGAWPAWQVIGAGIVLAMVTGAVVRAARRHPYLAVGWFWYLGTLVPVIGLVQVGSQAMADRYTYFPMIGLLMLVAWGVKDAASPWRHCRTALGLAGAVAVTACAGLTWAQLRYWQDGVTLFKHTVEVTSRNPVAQMELGSALVMSGEISEGMPHLREALRLEPGFAEAHGKMGLALARQGKMAEALDHYRQALRYEPNLVEVLNNLGWTLATSADERIRDGQAAIQHASQACELTHYRRPIMMGTLAAAYAEAGRFEEAVAMGEKARALATKVGEKELARKNEELVGLYRSGQPYREPPNF